MVVGAVLIRDGSGTWAAVAAPERIVFGSDWPFANAGVVAEAGTTYATVPLPADRRDAIDRRNALSLFPQFA
jgi:predicted TIM-barrel fold metal-dependent hydrolase